MSRPTLELIPDLPKERQLDVLAEIIAAIEALGDDRPGYTRLKMVRLGQGSQDAKGSFEGRPERDSTPATYR